VILVVSHQQDKHAAAVLAALARSGTAAALLDLAEFPRRGLVTLSQEGRQRQTLLTGADGRPIRAEELSAVWWRRPRPYEVDPGLSPEHAAHASAQTHEALSGALASLDVRWMNEPWADARACHKPFQLSVARAVGLRVPDTLVSNDPAEARRFLAARAGQPVALKLLATTRETWQPTRCVEPRDLESLDRLRLAPVILQEYVPGVDLRVTAVGGRLFAAAIDARRTDSPGDFRMAFEEAEVRPVPLPARLAARLRALLRRLGLAYAAIDLRLPARGEPFFLEANPSGQWLFLEPRTGLPITDAVAGFLAGGAAALRPARRTAGSSRSSAARSSPPPRRPPAARTGTPPARRAATRR